MNSANMKIAGLVGALLLCASVQVAAEVGQKPFPKIEGGSGEDTRPKQGPKPSAGDTSGPGVTSHQVCEAEGQGLLLASKENIANSRSSPNLMGRYTQEDLGLQKIGLGIEQDINIGNAFYTVACESIPRCKAFLQTKPVNTKPSSPNYREALLAWSDVMDVHVKTRSAGRGEVDFAEFRYRGCVARHMAANLNAAPGNTARNMNLAPPAIPAPPNPSANANQWDSSTNASRQTQQLNTQLSDAANLAQKHQADVDRARQGKPKRHVLGAEAHKCLKPQHGGGVKNACPYAVEYVYCVLHPTKDADSVFFDCEKPQLGFWQIGAGPNSISIMHTSGETTYWFACKYGETLHKPDGISPADVEYQRGRGLLGRCAEWVSKQG